MRTTLFSITVALCFIPLAGCGSSNPGDSDTNDPEPEPFDTQKLIGTPFEGITTGDDFEDSFFLCGEYKTQTIDSFPIKIFTAFFNEEEETTIQEGIDIANEAMGFTAYQFTEIWTDDVRVMYEDNAIFTLDGGLAAGLTLGDYVAFNNKTHAELEMPDWAIKLIDFPYSYLVAHELGHASGIRTHALIDYENDTLADLEEGSVMGNDGGTVLNDYTFMMQMQGQIMQNHLGEVGTLRGADDCGE